MMGRRPGNIFRWLFDSRRGPRGRLVPRWIFLRLLALIYFSAFLFAHLSNQWAHRAPGRVACAEVLARGCRCPGPAPLLVCADALLGIFKRAMLLAVTWIGLIASIVALVNVWPRLSFFVCFVCFLSFVTATEVFSMYQSDGMLLEAGFHCAVFCAGRNSAGMGRGSTSAAHEPVSAAVGVVPHLL